MLTYKPIKIKRVLIMVLMMGLYPLIGWAAPMEMTDTELDAIYAQGIFVDINVSVNLPGGGLFNMPSFNIPFPDMAGVKGSLNGGGAGSISVSPTTGGSTSTTGSTGNATPTVTASTPTSSGGSSTTPTPTTSTPPNTTISTPTNAPSTPVNSTPNIIPVAAGVSISKGSLQGNSGLIINAPAAAVSLVINVAVFNNSILKGNLSQNATSIPATMIMSFATSFR